ncbi:hypothetical protein [Burkholderia cepacia]|uniref:hypothetical protein n=1 Tax=Burkholderia cepacia TaxID=292 RepID=UPI003EE3F9E6
MQPTPFIFDHPVLPLMLQWFYGAVMPLALTAALMGVVLITAFVASRRPGRPLPPNLDDTNVPDRALVGATPAQAEARLRVKIAAFNASRARTNT